MPRGTKLWEDPRRTLTYAHAKDHRFVTAEELRDLAQNDSERRPVGEPEEGPFLICPYVEWEQKALQGEDMLQHFLRARTRRAFVDFADVWSIPSLIEPQSVGRYLFISWTRLTELQQRLNRVAALLTFRHETEQDGTLVRNPSDPEGWLERRDLDGTQMWQLTGLRSPLTDDATNPDRDFRLIALTIAAVEISSLIEHHTRNTFQYLEPARTAEVVRLSDPIGTMSLMLADRHMGGKPLKRCALNSCNRLFVPQYREDQQFCRRSHANSASNKRRRTRAEAVAPIRH